MPLISENTTVHPSPENTPDITAHPPMLRRSLTTLAGVATRAQAARAGAVATLNAPSYFSNLASSGADVRDKSDRNTHSRLAVASAWRGAELRAVSVRARPSFARNRPVFFWNGLFGSGR